MLLLLTAFLLVVILNFDVFNLFYNSLYSSLIFKILYSSVLQDTFKIIISFYLLFQGSRLHVRSSWMETITIVSFLSGFDAFN